MYYIGIDIGNNGAAALLDKDGVVMQELRFNRATLHDKADTFREWRDMGDGEHVVAMVEKVASSPQMGVRSAFTFGCGYGEILGILAALRIPYKTVTPGVWQKAMGCLSKGDKNITKAAAQRLYPALKITHADADAILIARYSVEHWNGL